MGGRRRQGERRVGAAPSSSSNEEDAVVETNGGIVDDGENGNHRDDHDDVPVPVPSRQQQTLRQHQLRQQHRSIRQEGIACDDSESTPFHNNVSATMTITTSSATTRNQNAPVRRASSDMMLDYANTSNHDSVEDGNSFGVGFCDGNNTNRNDVSGDENQQQHPQRQQHQQNQQQHQQTRRASMSSRRTTHSYMQQQQQHQAQKTSTLTNFVLMSVLFSANHGCVVTCLALATTQLGNVGAWQSGLLYLTYTGSALFGATYIVKELGSRNALITGMGCYILYVVCFWFAAITESSTTTMPSSTAATKTVIEFSSETYMNAASRNNAWTTSDKAALVGAAIGGIGAGFLWTAQGAYFTRAAQEHAALNNHGQRPVTSDDSTGHFAGIFAFIYLAEEVALRVLSTFLLVEIGYEWSTVFATYAVITIVSTVLMVFVREYPDDNDDVVDDDHPAAAATTELHADEDGEQQLQNSGIRDEAGIVSSSISNNTSSSLLYKFTAALQLLYNDPKMKYMIGFNAAFGFAGAFINSYVNAEVVPIVLGDHSNNNMLDSYNDPKRLIYGGIDNDGSQYIGVLTAWVSIVAAGMSLLFGKVSGTIGKGPILLVGGICFFLVAVPFLLEPYVQRWNWTLLFMVYTCHGIGRSVFEGTFKALFADYFAYEKEGAFANIILQNGLSSAVGYVLTFNLLCTRQSPYCVEYRDGSFHDVLTFELLVVISAAFAILGFWRASCLHRNTYEELPSSQEEPDTTTAEQPLLENNNSYDDDSVELNY